MNDMNHDGNSIRRGSQGVGATYIIHCDAGGLPYFGMLLQIKMDGGFSCLDALTVGCICLHVLFMNLIKATYSLGPGQFMQR